MTFLPVVHRELLVAARSGGLGTLRFLAALGGLGAFALLLASPYRGRPGELASLLFQVMGAAAFAYAFLSGPLHTVDAVGAEKREGTLGLLFLTDLRGLDVVLGKLASHSLRAVQGVLAVLPVLAIPMVYGGVSGAQFGRLAATLAATLFLSLSVGLAWSVVARDQRSALTGCAAVLGLLAALHAAGMILWRVPGWPAWALQQFSPVAAFRWARAEPWQDPAMRHWWGRSVSWCWWGGLGALAVASVAVGRWREAVVASPGRADDEARARASGLVGYRQYHWAALLARQPYAWFQRVVRPLPATFHLAFWGLVAAGLAAFAASFALPLHYQRGLALTALCGVLWATHLLLKVHVALSATRGMGEDRRSGALELLVVSGQGRDEIVGGHRAAIWTQYATPVSALLGLQLLPFLRMWFPGLPPVEYAPAMLVMLVAGAGFLVADVDALIRAGIRQALRQGAPQAAFRSAFLWVMVPGWVFLLPVGLLVLAGDGAWLVPVAAWVAASAYALYRVNKRGRIDLEHGFQDLAAGLEFDTGEWELRDDFRRAAMADVRAGPRGGFL